MIKKFINKLFYGTKATKATTAIKAAEGTVKFFNRSKGFGFITLKSSGEEIFVHKSDLVDKIRDKDKVSFDIEKEDKGLRAVNVRRIKKN
ncbi:MAG: cold shock domain-containing protein [Saprospiraceae bacterium]|nr:cold shock domain-containing protein [Saprospiraceae bacterium]